ncbi:hypothetical protein H2248_001461 [Termitomyces sp. 'cryptogamus']|nr:hypothetical protein H2248_001461 [Termitomyces sp. 'cryptogamus']
MSHLPSELYSLIFRFATWVPEAWYTSFEAVNEENRDTVIQLIHNASHTKVAISAVSKYFHTIIEPFLYETVVISRFQVIPSILKLLRSVPNGYTKPRGHMCHRLDVYLGTRRNPVYLGEAWSQGGHTLWGLIPACPRLEILVARVKYSGPDQRRREVPHPTYSALWKTISTYCAHTLRRLEIYNLSIRMSQVEMMLRYMTNLEALTTGKWVYQWNEADPTRQMLSWSRRAPKRVRFYEVLGRWFDDDIRREFLSTKRHASWPPYTGGPAPYLLPKLHTLFLNEFSERFFEFQLPMLRSLSTIVVWNEGIIWNTNAVLKPCNPDAPARHHINAHERENNFYKNPVPHSTPFGVFPSTITHLNIFSDIHIAKILYFFPNITDLTWQDNGMRKEILPFWKPHNALQCITLVLYGGWTSSTLMFLSPLQEVLNAVKDGWLLCLSEIVLGWRYGSVDSIPSPFKEECEELGIKISVTRVTEATLVDLHSWS